MSRFYFRYPQAKIEVVEYTAISRPAKIKCLKCGKILTRKIARQFLNGFDCCDSHIETRVDRLYRMYSKTNFEIIRVIDKDNVIVKHSVCGNEQHRNIASCLDNPFSCKYCNTLSAKNMMSIEEAQQQLDKTFSGEILLLEYNGQLEQNYYKCKKCGKVFKRKQVCLLESRGCPSCSRMISVGEKTVRNLLQSQGISFLEQYRVPSLPNQRFDFAVIKGDNSVQYFIEVQGEQHYRVVDIWGGEQGLKKRQELDQRKRDYCKSNNIPLYELILKKQKIMNLNILPFQSSTTISAKESTSQANGDGNGSCLQAG